MSDGGSRDPSAISGAPRLLRARPGFDTRDVALDAMEAFVLSLLEADTREDDLARIAELDEKPVLLAVRRLVAMGAVDVRSPPPPRATWPAPASPARRASLPREEPPSEPRLAHSAPPPGSDTRRRTPAPEHLGVIEAARHAPPQRDTIPEGRRARGETAPYAPPDSAPPPPFPPAPSAPPARSAPPVASVRVAQEAPAAWAPGRDARVDPDPVDRRHVTAPMMPPTIAPPPAREPSPRPSASPPPSPRPEAPPAPIAIPEEDRCRIEETFAALESSDHYRLLGIDRLADARSIKRAYYRLAADFHPDRWFGQPLGALAPKLDAIFARMTAAHDVLVDGELRARYDAALEAQRKTTRDPVPDSTGREAAAERERRAALARRLLASGGPRRTTGSGGTIPPPEPRRSAHEAAAAILRNRRDHATGPEHGRVQLQTYVAQAREAEAAGDVVAAANAYRLAVSIDPGDPELAAALERTAQAAAIANAPQYLARGDLFAQHLDWGEAASAYLKAVAGMPREPVVRQKAAAALLRSDGDLSRALELAREAVRLASSSLDARLTLVEVLLASGLRSAAGDELQAARKIDKKDPRLEALSRRLR